MGRIKIVIGAVVVVFVGVVVAGVAMLQSMDFNQYKGQIIAEVKKATGRDLRIDGNLDLAVSLSPKVMVDGVALSNAPWSSKPEMVTLKSFAAEMKLLPLVFGDIHIVELILIEPDIYLETQKDGTGNWTFETAQKTEEKTEESTAGGTTKLPAINSVRIEKANFVYVDGVKGETTSITVDLMQAQASDLSDPLNLLLKGSYNGHVIELSGEVGTPEDLMNSAPIDVDLVLKAADATVKLTGEIKQPLAGKGLNLALSAQSEDIAKLAEIVGTQVGKVGPFSMTATVSDTDKGYKVDGINLKVAESDLAGSIAADISSKPPYINVALTSKYLNIADLTPASAQTQETTAKAEDDAKKDTSKPAKIFPSESLPLDGLKAVNADVSFKAETLVANQFTLHDFSKTVSLKGGVLNVKPGFTMGGGALNGNITFNGSRAPALLDVNLIGKDLGLGASLKETGVTDLIDGGKTQVGIDLKSSGTSVATLMAGLDGKALINVGDGKINSKFINLAGGDLLSQLTNALNPFAKKQEFTPLKCMVVNLNFKDGVSKYDKEVAIQTDKMNVISSGTIDLKNELISIGIKPEPRGDAADLGINAGSLTSMVRLSGPLSKPGIGLDAMGTAKAAMGVASAIATGGVSLLVSGLADKVLADSDPCATALGQASASGGATQEKESAPDPVGGLLKMFGGSN